jgi:hypothetical protein
MVVIGMEMVATSVVMELEIVEVHIFMCKDMLGRKLQQLVVLGLMLVSINIGTFMPPRK